MDWVSIASLTFGGVGVATGVVSLALASRANKIAQEANNQVAAQTQIAREALAVAREAQETAKDAQRTAEDAHLIDQFVDADRARFKWTLNTPEAPEWILRVTEESPETPRDVLIRVSINDLAIPDRHECQLGSEAIEFDLREALDEMLASARGEVNGVNPISVGISCLIEWRGRSPKQLHKTLESDFYYPQHPGFVFF